MRAGLAHLFGRSLRARLVLVFSLVLVPPVLIAWGKAAYDYYDQRESLQRLSLQRAKLIATERDEVIQGARYLLKTLVELLATEPLGREFCEQNLRSALTGSPEYQSLVIFDPLGRVACSNRPFDHAVTLNDRDWFRAALAGTDFYVSQPLLSRLSQTTILVTAAPLRSSTGAVIGVIAASIPWDRLTAPADAGDLPDAASLAVVDRSGRIFPFQAGLTRSRRAPVEDALMQSFANGPPPVAPTGAIIVGKATEWALAPFAGGALFVALGQPRDLIDQRLNLPLLLGLALPALIWVAAVATAWMAANRLIVRWVLRVREFAASSAAGRPTDLGERLGEAPRELQELATSLRRMMEIIRQRNAELRDALDNRETLIKEIHHRVKNNLQIIASLLNLQMRGIRDGAARDAMMTVRNRVNALALIHRSLYETDELQQVELKEFLRALADQVAEFLDARERHIDVDVDIPTMSVPAEAAVTLALLVTEALSNAFKHAFPVQYNGHVSIRLEPLPSGSIVLTIADDGIGGVHQDAVADEADLPDSNLGHQLMVGYARQLAGTLTIDDAGGTIIRVELPSLAFTGGSGRPPPEAASAAA